MKNLLCLECGRVAPPPTLRNHQRQKKHTGQEPTNDKKRFKWIEESYFTDTCDFCLTKFTNNYEERKKHCGCMDRTTVKQCPSCGDVLILHKSQKYCSRRCAEIGSRVPKEPKVYKRRTPRYKCGDCDKVTNKAWMTKHQKQTDHTGLSLVSVQEPTP